MIQYSFGFLINELDSLMQHHRHTYIEYLISSSMHITLHAGRRWNNPRSRVISGRVNTISWISIFLHRWTSTTTSDIDSVTWSLWTGLNSISRVSPYFMRLAPNKSANRSLTLSDADAFSVCHSIVWASNWVSLFDHDSDPVLWCMLAIGNWISLENCYLCGASSVARSYAWRKCK